MQLPASAWVRVFLPPIHHNVLEGRRRGEEGGRSGIRVSLVACLPLSLSLSHIGDREEEARLQFSKRENQIETKGLAWIWIVAYCMGAKPGVFFSNEPAASSPWALGVLCTLVWNLVWIEDDEGVEDGGCEGLLVENGNFT